MNRRCAWSLEWAVVGLVLLIVLGATSALSGASSFAIGEKDFLLAGKPFLVRCGEMHFARIPQEYWQHRLRLARAMGLNTVCAYVFWNSVEPEPGRFDFSGANDVARFCRQAQTEGLKVILRPGPYSCAEWDFGGLPYWLLKIPDIKLRSRDPRFLEACRRYLQALGQQLAPLQVTRGGPIIMVQVENEYGSYGNDKRYIGLLSGYLKEAGFEVPLFTCDGPKQLANDVCDDIFCVVNFGSNPEKNFKALRKLRASGPLMCGEYYPGWFDSWGQKHHTGNTAKVINELGWMLGHNASFSIYMVHGGTSFGFSAGANSPPFSPQITSYDYDAPITEAGWASPKYYALRALFLKHLAPGESLPEVPPRKPVIRIQPMELTEFAPLLASLPPARYSEHPLSLEMMDQAHGAVLYRTRLPPVAASRWFCRRCTTTAWSFSMGKKIATLDRRKDQNSVVLPRREQATVLSLLIDTFGHVNYGRDLLDRKGITEKVELSAPGRTNELTGWEMFNLPLDAKELAGLKFRPGATDAPAFYRARFEVTQPGDTFFDFRTWGKGVAWVNGHNLGRFWDIGPQQTLYCPGPWLKAGRNEVIVLEFNGARKHTLSGLEEPILDQVRETSATN